MVYDTPQGIIFLFLGVVLIFGSMGNRRKNRLFDIELSEKEHRKSKIVLMITGLVFILLSFIVDTVISWGS